MSLAFYAAPVNNNNIDNSENNEKKHLKTTNGIRSLKNITYKNRNPPKINKEMIDDILSENDDNDDNDNNLGKFNPINQSNNQSNNEHQNTFSNTSANIKENITSDNRDYSLLNNAYENISQHNSYLPEPVRAINNTELLQKLDNILYLLEEQQEEKTNYITEELILYIFLGVFIIYVLDSFVRIGKYVR